MTTYASPVGTKSPTGQTWNSLPQPDATGVPPVGSSTSVALGSWNTFPQKVATPDGIMTGGGGGGGGGEFAFPI